MARALGFDLGGTKLLACLVDGAGAVHAEVRHATGRGLDPQAGIDLLAEAASQLRAMGGEFDSVGVGFPGLVDGREGMVLSSVILDGWSRVPLAALVSERLGLPCVIDNDVNNAARAEVHCRPDADHLLFVSVGTGIGGALVFNRTVWTSVTGLAGEIGHVSLGRRGPRCECGRRGCVGVTASGAYIEQRLGIPLGRVPLDGDLDDTLVEAVIGEAAEALGAGIADALNLLSLPLVVLGGGVAEFGDPYVDVVSRTVRREAFDEITARCRIERARAGYRAGAIGSGLLALGDPVRAVA